MNAKEFVDSKLGRWIGDSYSLYSIYELMEQFEALKNIQYDCLNLELKVAYKDLEQKEMDIENLESDLDSSEQRRDMLESELDMVTNRMIDWKKSTFNAEANLEQALADVENLQSKNIIMEDNLTEWKDECLALRDDLKDMEYNSQTWERNYNSSVELNHKLREEINVLKNTSKNWERLYLDMCGEYNTINRKYHAVLTSEPDAVKLRAKVEELEYMMKELSVERYKYLTQKEAAELNARNVKDMFYSMERDKNKWYQCYTSVVECNHKLNALNRELEDKISKASVILDC